MEYVSADNINDSGTGSSESRLSKQSSGSSEFESRNSGFEGDCLNTLGNRSTDRSEIFIGHGLLEKCIM